MKNTLTRSYQDEHGQWWYVQRRGTRQRAIVKRCKTCSDEFLCYPNGGSDYCSLECYRKPCATCGVEFGPRTKRQAYCSEDCQRGSATCEHCGVSFVVGKKANGRFCSTRCFYDFTCPLGTVSAHHGGYRVIKVPPGTPGALASGARAKNWMLHHRYVMQQVLGRDLLPSEHVHHKNGKRDDNRPENLELWKRAHPSGVRQKDYHCAGCNCFKPFSGALT
jgi:hypothetical protein